MLPSDSPRSSGWSLFGVCFAVAVVLALAGCNDAVTPGMEEDVRRDTRVTLQASATPATVSASQQVVIRLSVTASAAVTADVTLRVLRPDGTVAHTASWPAQSLAARTPHVLEETMTIAPGEPSGTYSIGARVQRTGSTQVFSDTNSLSSFVVAASPSSGSPDLVVTQVDLSPSSPRAGNAVTFSATVKNQGTAATPAETILGVRFSVDGTTVAWSDTYNQALAAGASVTLSANGGPTGSATWTATSGAHQVAALADDVDRIPNESSESNNELARAFTVGTVCTPACSGRVCGADGCGGSCGSCASGQTCNTSGQCIVASTLPPLWNASPPAGVSAAPSGPVVGRAGEFDTGTLATNEIWDNFNGPAGSNPDNRLWLEDTINQGGTQVYDPARSFLDGNGNAVLEAIQSGSTIYSGRFTSRTKFNMQYGWAAARIRFPKAGRSWFPAFWMLLVGYNYNPYGEIDLMEFFGNTNEYSTHIHFGDPLPSLESNRAVPATHSGGNAGDGFHTYWMQWEPDRIRIGVDDLIMGDWTPASVPAGAWEHMRQPFYFIANFAVAPSWLPPPLTTDFPARMQIDWIWYKPL